MGLQPALVGLIYTLAIMVAVVLLIWFKRMGRKTTLLLVGLAVAVPGVVLGGLPDPVVPIQQIPYGLAHGGVGLALLAGLLIVLLTTVVAGRIFCGYVCPFGAVQELLYRVNVKKVKVNDKLARYSRIAVLILFITLGFATVVYPAIDPFSVFTFSPGLPALLVFLAVSVAAVVLYRPWCMFICPFGAIADLTARLSVFKLKTNNKCNHCGLCDRVCPARQSVQSQKLSSCYYCGRCLKACRKEAIEGHFSIPGSGEKAREVTVKYNKNDQL